MRLGRKVAFAELFFFSVLNLDIRADSQTLSFFYISRREKLSARGRAIRVHHGDPEEGRLFTAIFSCAANGRLLTVWSPSTEKVV